MFSDRQRARDLKTLDPWDIEQRLRWYEELIDHLPISVFFKDTDGRYTMANNHFTESLQTVVPVDRQGLVGNTDADLIHDREAETYRHKDRQVLAGKALLGVIEPLEKLDGSAEMYRTTKLPLRDADGQIHGLMGFSTPLWGSATIADALERSERRYRLALRAARDGIWEFDPATVTIELSHSAYQLLQLDFADERIPVSDIMRKTTRDHARRLIRAFKEVIDDPTQSISVEFPITLTDRTHWLHLQGAALVEDGTTDRIIGSLIDVTETVEAQERLIHYALHDDHTGLPNRRALLDHLERILETSENYSLLFLDLDDFKSVNDSLGHQAGDNLLVHIAQRLRDVCGPHDLISRIGGDEFAIVISERDRTTAQGRATAEALLASFVEPFQLDEGQIRASASIGFVATGNYDQTDKLLHDADTAMYDAKADKGCISEFVPTGRTGALRAQKLQDRIRAALDRGEFSLKYQPIVDTRSGSPTAVEALLRWAPTGNTPLSPTMFLPYLEQTGQITEVGRWVIDEGCRQLADWRAHGLLANTRVSINLSARQLEDPELVDNVAASLAEAGLAGSDLMFEIDGTSIGQAGDIRNRRLDELRSTGAKIAFDDFGSGRCFLETLDELPLDCIKIDPSLIGRIDSAIDSRLATLRATMSVGSALGLAVIAEGVETETQARWLADHGCDALQGHFLDSPRDPAVFYLG